MSGLYGVENIKKAFGLLIELGNVGDYIGSHPELGLAKWSKATDLADELMGLTSFNFEDMKKEFTDMDSVDRAEVIKFVKEKFNLNDDDLEVKIEDGFDLGVQAYEIVTKIIVFSKSFSSEPVV